MKNSILITKPLPLVIPRMIVGLVFLSEGVQKFVVPGLVGAGRFAKIVLLFLGSGNYSVDQYLIKRGERA
ncbi:MAG: hypothetical protein P0Y49_12185 [Candidatus Pedobacter colombiensis]|uniref:DoxX family protein n=1 Tax=Candidatus Pedobacter colombiensis TaxID=3121371 RepID=A0AAJ6B5A0_9SPHI|nr:hypothetical protein [Pedobacter sp.]WEK17554.1 MAG: hypothetical protein P0Y49_12185 [Pedobacter sp.]